MDDMAFTEGKGTPCSSSTLQQDFGHFRQPLSYMYSEGQIFLMIFFHQN